MVDALIEILVVEAPQLLRRVLLAAAAGLGLWLLSSWASQKVAERIEHGSLEKSEYLQKNIKLIRSSIFVVFIVFSVLVMFEILGVETALIMGGLSLGVGFAMETTIGNMVSGVFLLLNRRLRVGKMIEMGGQFNQKVTIEEFHLRYTVLETLSKQRLIVPNSTMFRTPIVTLKQEKLLRGKLAISLPRGAERETMRDSIVAIVNANEFVVHPEATTVVLQNFSARGFDLLIFYFLEPDRGQIEFGVNDKLRREISKVRAAKGRKFPVPQQRVDFRGK